MQPVEVLILARTRIFIQVSLSLKSQVFSTIYSLFSWAVLPQFILWFKCSISQTDNAFKEILKEAQCIPVASTIYSRYKTDFKEKKKIGSIS